MFAGIQVLLIVPGGKCSLTLAVNHMKTDGLRPMFHVKRVGLGRVGSSDNEKPKAKRECQIARQFPFRWDRRWGNRSISLVIAQCDIAGVKLSWFPSGAIGAGLNIWDSQFKAIPNRLSTLNSKERLPFMNKIATVVTIRDIFVYTSLIMR